MMMLPLISVNYRECLFMSVHIAIIFAFEYSVRSLTLITFDSQKINNKRAEKVS